MGDDGESELWCEACGCSLTQLGVADTSEFEAEATGEAVVRYLSLRYSVDLSEAIRLVGDHVPELFDGIDARRSARVVGDELAAVAELSLRVPVCMN